jgi:hypothetical protein
MAFYSGNPEPKPLPLNSVPVPNCCARPLRPQLCQRAATRQGTPPVFRLRPSLPAMNKNNAAAGPNAGGNQNRIPLMRNPTVYLKMRVLGAVDMAEGNTERKRIQAVSQMTFTDEEEGGLVTISEW